MNQKLPMLKLSKIKQEISPTKKEEQNLQKKVSSILTKINKHLKNAKAIPGGSFAKGTWLKHDHDIDIFVQFKAKTNISNKLEEALKKEFKTIKRVHGSRDYFQIRTLNVDIELVPVYKIKKDTEAKNITDISPLHAEFVNKKTDKELKQEIRLAKQFFKAQEIYGAETYIKGFSGYVLELLIIYYGSFFNLIRAMKSWEKGQEIQFTKTEKALDKNKESPLIIRDPVQSNRNAAAALSLEKFNQAKKIAEEFYNNPKKSYFQEKKESINPKHYDIILKVQPLKGKSKDVTGTKLLKTFEKLQQELNKKGFTVKKAKWTWDKTAYFYLKLKTTLPKTETLEGPPLTKKQDLEKFTKKHKKVRKKGNRVYAKRERNYTRARDFLKDLLKSKEITKRVKSIKLEKQI